MSFTGKNLMSKYLGNCSHLINWKDVIDHLEDTSPGENFDKELITKILTTTNSDNCDDKDHNRSTAKKWIENGYNLDSFNFQLYRPKKHYRLDISTEVSKFIGGIELTSSISRVPSGALVPMHEDSTPNVKPGKIVKRYVCFISPAIIGQVFTLDNECFHNIDLGNIYEWDNMYQLHSSSNTSNKPQYLFHIECFMGDIIE